MGMRGKSCRRKGRGRRSLRRTWVLEQTGARQGNVLTVWVGGRLYYVQELHIRDVVDVDLDLEDDNERLAVELDGENGGGEEELANHGLPLFRGGMSVSGNRPQTEQKECPGRFTQRGSVIQRRAAGNGSRKGVLGVECWKLYIPWC